ncbi:hypothetical protein [Treponema bryantii]|uniref:hypothetical protein n=1 Tax=Treponema bryantii TaxID=163 RepID=UPI0003B6B97F|nr:hypothetical protein [Treponema bryantii]
MENISIILSDLDGTLFRDDKFWTFNDFSDFRETCMKMCIESLDKEKVEKVASVNCMFRHCVIASVAKQSI